MRAFILCLFYPVTLGASVAIACDSAGAPDLPSKFYDGACWSIQACAGVTIEACDNSAPCVCVDATCYCDNVPNPEALCAR